MSLTAQAVLERVLREGGQVIPDPVRPRLRVPAHLEALVAKHREALKALILSQAAPSDLKIARSAHGSRLAHLLSMPLADFGREGQPLEILVHWWPETLFFVPSLRDVEGLRGEGIERYRVWTAHELATLLQRPHLDSESLRLDMVVRREFDGKVVQADQRRRDE